MKKLLLAICVTMVSTVSFAQWSSGSFTVQPKVGLNIANITDGEGASSRLGLVAGAEFEYQLSSKFSLAAGLLYSQQGAKDKDSGVTGTLKLDYLNIPVVANIYVAPGFAFKVGLQPGINLSSKISGSSGGADVTVDLSDLGMEVESFDLALPLGLSYEFSNFVIDGRYNLGLTKFLENSKNNVIQLTLGYKFSLF